MKELARAKNKSRAWIIREALDQFLKNRHQGSQSLYSEALKIVGKYKCGASDISTEHGRYLEEDFIK